MNDLKKTKEEFVEKVRASCSRFEKIEYSKPRSRYEEKKAWLLSSAVEQCSEGIAISDLEGNLLFVNEAFATIHGYTKEGLIGKHLSIFHTTEQMPSVDAANRQLQETGEFCGEIWHVRKNGEIFSTEMHNSILLDEQRNPIGMTGTILDITERKKAEQIRSALTHDMDERVKELNCLYGISRLVESSDNSLDRIIQETANLIPASWQYPEITCARIIVNDKVFVTENFQQSAWKQQAEIWRLEQRIGVVEVYYLDQKSQSDEGPFLKQERNLIDAIAERLGRIVERIQLHEKLSEHQEHLEELIQKRTAELAKANEELQVEISERKLAEEALQDSEERFRTSVENMLDCFGIYTAIRDESGSIADFRIEYVNKAACVNNHMTKEEQIGKRLLELMPAHRETGLFDKYCQVVETGRPLVEESLIYEDVYKKKHLIRVFDIRTVKFGDGFAAAWRDVTERKRAEQELRKNQRMLIRAQNIAGMGFLTWNMITNEIQWSDKIFNIYGIDQQKVKPTLELTMQLVHPDDLEFVQKNLDMAIQGVTEYDIDHRILRPDGKVVWIHAQAELTKDTDGISLLLGTVVDITKRKQTEKALRESEERFNLAVNGSNEGIWDWPDINNDSTWWSPRLYELLGYQDGEIEASFSKFEEMLHPDDRDKTKQAIQDHLDKHLPIDIEHRLRTKSGEYQWFQSRGQALWDDKGNAIRMSGSVHNITERKKIEELLKVKDTAIASSISGIGIADLEGKITYVNDSLVKMWGYDSTDEFLGRPLYEFMEGEEAFEIIKALREKGGSIGENIGKRKDGSLFNVQFVASMIKDQANNPLYMFGSFLDITERKELDKKLMTYQNNLRSLASKLVLTEEHHRQQIAANMHDNISQALALSVNQLRRLCESVAPADAETLDEICRTIEETSQNVRDLTFDLASPLLYKFGLKVAISEILDEQLRNRHGIVCKFSDDKKDKPLDDNVRVLLFQTVRELLINVVKHAKASKVEITIQRENDNIQIIISDDGVGFDTKKAETAIQRSGGFGLFNSRERLDYIGGSFEMYSQPGSGSRFVLTAPIKTKTD